MIYRMVSETGADVAINIELVTSVRPAARGTEIHLMGGDKVVVRGVFGDTINALQGEEKRIRTVLRPKVDKG